MKYLTNGDQWKEGHAVTETQVFDRISNLPKLCRSTAFSPTVLLLPLLLSLAARVWPEEWYNFY